MGVSDEAKMQRGRGDKKPVRQGRYDRPQSEFVNLELNKEQTAEYRVWRNDVEAVCDLWTELVEGGYRVNTKWDDYSNSCAAFIIPDAGGENDGFILTGRGGNPYRALAEAVYKHFVVLHGEWADAFNTKSGSSDPDF